MIEALNFGAHLFKNFGFIDTDASFRDAEFLGNFGVGDFLGDVFEYVTFVFMKVVFDVFPGEVGDVKNPFFSSKFFDVW